MSSTLAALAVLMLPPVTAQQEPEQPSLLGPSDVKALNREAKKWFQAWWRYEYDSPKPRERQKNGKALTKARERFERTLKAKSKKGDPLSSVADVRAIFANAFEYPRQSTSGEMKAIKADSDLPGYTLLAPRGYDPDEGYRTMVVLPGFDEAKGSWTSAKDHFVATWSGAELSKETLFVFPALRDDMVLDVDPDFTKANAEDQENERNRAVFGPFGQVQREFNVDRERCFLDCGRGASKFGLRLATYFPDRFAGVILRWPAESDAMRVGSLQGSPILMIVNDETRAAAEALRKRLDGENGEGGDGACKILEAKGEYPYAEMQSEIAAWVEGTRRQLDRAKVVLEPNSDRFNNGFWVLVGTAEPLMSLPKAERPMLVAEADREANRIEVTARNIQDFRLLLNDAIVDLDKPFTVVINGEATKQQQERNLRWMVEQMRGRFDSSYVFTSYFDGTVPKADDSAATGSKTGGN